MVTYLKRVYIIIHHCLSVIVYKQLITAAIANCSVSQISRGKEVGYKLPPTKENSYELMKGWRMKGDTFMADRQRRKSSHK